MAHSPLAHRRRRQWARSSGERDTSRRRANGYPSATLTSDGADQPGIVSIDQAHHWLQEYARAGGLRYRRGLVRGPGGTAHDVGAGANGGLLAACQARGGSFCALASCRRCVVSINPMWMTTRCSAPIAGLLLAVLLLLTGCEEATKPPPMVTAPDDTPRPPAGKPTDPKPAHNATGVTLDTELEWSAATGSTGYVVYFGTDPKPEGDELIDEQAETTFDPEMLEYDTIYYWRVDSKNEIGTITGDVWRFRTEPSPPPKPAKATTPSPAHEDTGVRRTTALGWSPTPAATSYQVYFGTEPSPGSKELHGEQTPTTFEPNMALEYGTIYYWRIDSLNAGGTTTGDVWSFTTVVQPPPKATNPQPENGATNVLLRDDLMWTAAPGATSYIVYFGTALSPGNDELKGEQDGTNTEFDATLTYGTTYYWRVDSKNAGGTTAGDVWSFTTVSQAQ